MLGRTLEMPSHALVENTFWDFPPPNTTHERFGDLFSCLYPVKSPSDLNGILILVKTSIYTTQAKWRAKEDKWADMHFPSLGREGTIGGSSINALTVSLWTLAHGKCFCQSVVGKGTVLIKGSLFPWPPTVCTHQELPHSILGEKICMRSSSVSECHSYFKAKLYVTELRQPRVYSCLKT